MSKVFDVGVVGCGACGAVITEFFLKQGLSVVVFDKWPGVLEIPRAAHIDDETMRTFQALGVDHDLAASVIPSTDYGIFNAHNERVNGFAAIVDEPTDQGWISDYFFVQPELEHYLRNKSKEKGAEFKLNCEVIALDERADDVLVTYVDKEHGKEPSPEQLNVRYLIGADGANSFVRKWLGSEMEELAPDQRWMICDIQVHDDVEASFSHDAWTKVTPEETITFVNMPKNMKRFEFSVADHVSDDQVKTPEAITEFLSKWVQPGDYDILRAHVYHFHALVAKGWGRGRVWIAGDSAHTTPPFLGQGVCAAIRDALNLAWKVARVVKGQSGASLLETYESERHPHAYDLVKVAGDVGEQLDWMAQASPSELKAMEKQDYEHMQVRPSLGPGLHAPSARCGGKLSPQPRLADGSLLDDSLGYNFGLVGDASLIEALPSDTLDQLNHIGAVIVADDSDAVRSALALLGGSVMLIRPDRYLLGVARSLDEVQLLVEHLANSLGCTEEV